MTPYLLTYAILVTLTAVLQTLRLRISRAERKEWESVARSAVAAIQSGKTALEKARMICGYAERMVQPRKRP